MLSEILNLLKERGAMSLAELTLALGSETAAVEGMLETLQSKGRVTRLDTKCSNCKGCIEVKREDALIFQCLEK